MSTVGLYAAFGSHHGLGHLHRMMTLYHELKRPEYGFQDVYLKRFRHDSLGDGTPVVEHIQATRPGIIVLDMLVDFSWNQWKAIYAALGNPRKVVMVRGVGHFHLFGPREVDALIVQGIWAGDRPRGAIWFKAGIPWLLVRPEAVEMGKQGVEEFEWFVYPGAVDPANMAEDLAHVVPPPSILVVTKFTPQRRKVMDVWQEKGHVVLFDPGRKKFLSHMARAKRVVVHMGMAAWEAVAMGRPTWVVAGSDLHLDQALKAAARGYVRAWPEVGKPDWDTFLAQENPGPLVPGPDGLAARRVASLIKRLARLRIR